MYEVVYSRADLQHGPPSVASHSVGWITSWNAPTISRVVHTQWPKLVNMSWMSVSSQVRPSRGVQCVKKG